MSSGCLRFFSFQEDSSSRHAAGLRNDKKSDMEINAGFTAILVVLVIRFFLPLTILKWPVGGFLLAILGDIADVMILQKWPPDIDPLYYHRFDNFFDTYYLFFAYLASRKWADPLARKTAAYLYWWRFAGFVIYEATGFQAIFALAPNIFENFYLFGAVIHKWFVSYRLTWLRLGVWLLILGLPKVFQEYIMHYRYPGSAWAFFRDNVFWWIYPAP